jgi:malate dehydrogenase (oxaloacetate-decarboxylating)
MKLAAAQAIAAVIPDDELHPEYIIPSVFNHHVVDAVAAAVADAAITTGVARRTHDRPARDVGDPRRAQDHPDVAHLEWLHRS